MANVGLLDENQSGDFPGKVRTPQMEVVGARGAKLVIRQVSATVTVSGATTSATNLIPAGATVLRVDTRVDSALTGATTGYNVGDGTDADKWGSITGTAVGTHSAGDNYTAGAPAHYASATSVVLTALTSNFTAGAITVSAFIMESEEPKIG